MKVRHLKRRLCSFGMRHAVSTWIIKDTLRSCGVLNNTQKRLLHYRGYWK